MNIKEQENQLSVSLNLRTVVNIIAYLGLVAFIAYRLYLVSQVSGLPLVSGVAVPRLKVDNFDSLSLTLKATESVTPIGSASRPEPFD